MGKEKNMLPEADGVNVKSPYPSPMTWAGFHNVPAVSQPIFLYFHRDLAVVTNIYVVRRQCVDRGMLMGGGGSLWVALMSDASSHRAH